MSNINDFEIENGVLKNYKGPGGDVVIPEGVTSIGKCAFKYCSSLASVTIPDSVTSIGDSAFSRCSSLTSVTIPDSVTSIGEWAFYECSSLTSVTIPDSMTRINDCTFCGCSSLASVTIPDSVTSIGDWAFEGCRKLKSVTIPDSVTDVEKSPFTECLKIITVNASYKTMLRIKNAWRQLLKPYLNMALSGSEEEIEDRVHFVRNAPKGKRVEFARRLITSDSKAIAGLFEELGILDEYAAAHGTDADALRDSLLSDFGLDINGCRFWPLAGSTITAKLNLDLTLTITDASGKVLKSVPKKNADPAEYEAAKKETAQLKKDIIAAAKLRNDRLLREFLSGRERDAKSWKSAYLGNPLLRLLARLLVWQQGENTFTLREDGTACDAAGNDYEISSQPVFLAHPMEPGKETTEAWQEYFLSRNLRQPFEQVWEPVAEASLVEPGRYDGCTVPRYMLMNKEKHGIIIEEQNRLTLKDCSAGLKPIRYRDWYNNEFEVTDFKFDKFTRQVNHIVVHLDKATVAGRIKKDDVSVAQSFSIFTAAQITEFIDLAAQSSAPNCTALLLDYKNRTWPAIDPFAAFTLDLL